MIIAALRERGGGEMIIGNEQNSFFIIILTGIARPAIFYNYFSTVDLL